MKLMIALLFLIGTIAFSINRSAESKREREKLGSPFEKGEYLANVALNTLFTYVVTAIALGIVYAIAYFGHVILDVLMYVIEAVFWQL